jgi:hypothetical protein
MISENTARLDTARVLTSFAADLADAAYHVVLRQGFEGSWIDLQLDVWRVLASSVTQLERTTSRSPTPAEFLAWREVFLSELTDAAYRTVLQHRLHGSFLEIELELNLALRAVIERSRSTTGLKFVYGASVRTIADAVLARADRHVAPPAEMECCI